MRRAVTALFLLLLAGLSRGMVINEIMHNPAGADSGREWIEIFNSGGEQNLTGWKINTDGTDHALNPPPANGGRGSMVISPGEYVIIAQDAALFTNSYSFNGTVIDSSWQDLSNSQNETVWLRNSTAIVSNITSFPAAEGNSTCLINGSLAECPPTPGFANALQQNESSQTADSCSVSVELVASELYGIETVSFDIKLNDTACTQKNVTVNYLVEDLFGSVVKPQVSTASSFSCSETITRQWTPDEITGSEAYYIRANISNITCSDTADGNSASKLIVIRGSQLSQAANSSITINSVGVGSDNEIKYGESGEISLTVYRGDTSLNAVNVFVQSAGGAKLSETTNFNVNTRFVNYSLSVPVQMKPNCDNSLPEGSHFVNVTGLGLTETRTVSVRGVSPDACKTTVVSSSSGGSSSGSSSVSAAAANRSQPYEMLSYPDRLYAGRRFAVKLRIINDLAAEKNFSVYSYVYKDSVPVSLGLGASGWSAAWDANKQAVKIPPKSRATVSLESVIENKTPAGRYMLNVRIKSDRESDIRNEVEVLEQPRLTVGEENQTISMETNCPECTIMLLPEGLVFNATEASAEAQPGKHYVLLLKENELLEKAALDISAPETAVQEERSIPVTGLAVNASLLSDIEAAAKAVVLLMAAKFA